MESALKTGVNNSHKLAKALALYWINGERDTAQLYYKQLLDRYPEFTLDTLRKDLEVWSDAKVTRDLLQKAFKEIVDASKRKDAVE